MNIQRYRSLAVAFVLVIVLLLIPGEAGALKPGASDAGKMPIIPQGYQQSVDAKEGSRDYRLVASTWGAIGSSTSSADFRVGYTLGQPSMIGRAASANYNLSSGFWAAVLFTMNEPPVAQDDNITTKEDTSVNFNVLANDSDENLDPGSVTIVSAPSKGTLINKGNGDFDYKPNADVFGDDAFTYQVCDYFDLCATAQVNIQITEVNDSPWLKTNEILITSKGSRSRITDENHLWVEDVDNPPEEIIIVINSIPQKGALLLQQEGAGLKSLAVMDWFTQADINNDRLTYRHDGQEDHLGGDSFHFTVYDSLGAWTEGIFSIDVALKNVPPEASDDTFSTDEDTSLIISVPSLLANDYDAEDDLLKAALASGAEHGALTLNADGSFNYEPAANFNGLDRFVYSVADYPVDDGEVEPNNPPVSAQAFITVNPINDPPTDIGLSNSLIDENHPAGTVVGVLITVDADLDDHHSYALVAGGADNAYFDIVTEKVNNDFIHRLRTRVSFDYEAKSAYTIRVETRDSKGSTFAKSFTVTVIDINEIPTISLSYDAVLENKEIGSLVGVFSAVDPEKRPISFSLVPGAADNNRFQISFNSSINQYELKTKDIFDYETGIRPYIRVGIEDGTGWREEKSYQISILNDLRDDVDTKCNGRDFYLFGTQGTHGWARIHDITITEYSASGCKLSGFMQIGIRGYSTADTIRIIGNVNARNELYSQSIDEFTMLVAGFGLKVNSVTIEYYNEMPMLRVKNPQLMAPTAWGGLAVPIPVKTIIDSRGLIIAEPIKLPTIGPIGGFDLRLTGKLMAVAEGYEISAEGRFSIPGISYAGAEDSCGILAAVTFYVETDGSTAMRIETIPVVNSLLSPGSLALRELTLGISCTYGIPIDTTGFALTGVKGTVNLTPDAQFVRLEVTISSMEQLGASPLIQVVGWTKVTVNPELVLELGGILKQLSFEVSASARIAKKSFGATIEITTDLIKGKVSFNTWINGGDFHFSGSGEVYLGVKENALGGPWCMDYPCRIIWCSKYGVPYPCGVDICHGCNGIPPSGIWLGPAGCEFGEFANGAYGMKGYVKFSGATYGFYIDHNGNVDYGNVSQYVLAQPPQVAQFSQVAGKASLRHTLLGTQPAQADAYCNSESSTEATCGPVTIDQTNVSFIVDASGPLEMTLIDPDGRVITPDDHQGYPVRYMQETSYTLESYELESEPVADPDQPELKMPRLRFISASPNPDFSVVDIKLDDVTVLSGVGFTDLDQPEYMRINAGDHTLSILPTDPSKPPITTSFRATAGQDYSVLTIGETVANAIVLEDANQMPETPGNARVRFINGSEHYTSVHFYLGGTEVAACVAGICDYQEIAAGTYDLGIMDSANSKNLSELAQVSLQENAVYTFVAVDWIMGEYSLAWLQTLDASYMPMSRMQYDLYSAPTGDWQVRLTGDVEGTVYTLAVLSRATSPILRELTVDASNIEETRVKWRLWADYSPTVVKVYATKGPITETIEATDMQGISGTRLVPVFKGILLDEVSIMDEGQLSGDLMMSVVNLANLETGDYYLWILAEDGTIEGSANPTVVGYIGGTDVDANQADYDPLEQLENATVIHVDHTATFPQSWTADIRTSLDIEDAKLGVEWDVLAHPDVDQYTLHVNSPGLEEHIINAGAAIAEYDQAGNLIGSPVGVAILRPIEPNRTYNLSVEAQDLDSGKNVRSQEVPFAISAGDFSLTTPVTRFEPDPGDVLVLPISLVITEPLFYPNVHLAISLEDTRWGIEAVFVGDLAGTTALSAENQTADLRISIASDTPRGLYSITVWGYNGSIERELKILLIMNTPPVASDDRYATDENIILVVDAPGLLANDTDPDGDPLTVTQVYDSGLIGSLIWNPNGSFEYNPNGKFDYLGSGEEAVEAFGYTIEDGKDGVANARATIKITGVNDGPVIGSAEPVSQSLQYSDRIALVTIGAGDIDSSALVISQAALIDASKGITWPLADTGLEFSPGTCQTANGEFSCDWILVGSIQLPAGTYDLAITVGDGEAETTKQFAGLLEVAAEAATVTLDDDNPHAVEVAQYGGSSGSFTITVFVKETVPDEAPYGADPGNVGHAEVSMRLVAVGPGSSVEGTCQPVGVRGSGYEADLEVTCGFGGVPVNTYIVQALAEGGYYSGGSEDVLTVYDPSLGTAAGIGSFSWPDGGDHAAFSFFARYALRDLAIHGKLLLVVEGSSGAVVRSTALYGLSIGGLRDAPFKWAAFSGEGFCADEAGNDPEPNCRFIVYVEDHDMSGAGADKFWIAALDQNGKIIEDVSMDRPAIGNAVTLDEGNIEILPIPSRPPRPIIPPRERDRPIPDRPIPDRPVPDRPLPDRPGEPPRDRGNRGR